MCIITSTAIATALGLAATITSGAAAGTVVSTAPVLTGILAGVANATLGAGLIGGAVSGIVGGIQSGKAAQAEAEYQANIARQNAKIAEQNAAQERQAGLEDARKQRMKTMAAIGEQKVGIAANGAEIGSGTAIDTIEDTATLGELDALTVQYNAEQRALNYEQQANNFNNQANLDVLKGQNAATAGKINAISAGFKGLSNSMNTLAGGFGSGFGSSLGGGKQKIYSVNSFNRKYKNTYAMGDLV